MKRILFLGILCLCVHGLEVCNLSGGEKPNVIIVITDDQGYGDLSCHGNPRLKTPAIDRLYEQSVRLTDYHVSPTCSPTRAALLTGHWTNRTGVWHTIMGRSMLRENEVTIGDVFKASGYQTGMFGKWHLGDNHPYRPKDRGFTEVLRHGGGGVGQTPDFWDNAYIDGSYWHNGKTVPVQGYCTDVFFDYAKSFITECHKNDQPFFAYVATNAPHGPMHAPPGTTATYDDLGPNVANFFGMIANIDDNVAELRKMLDRLGIADDTILIFTTDNGTSSGANVFNAEMRGRKGSQYDGGHRVPFFIRWPNGKLIGGRDVSRLTAHVDVLPTLISLCGIEAPEAVKFDGVDLSPLLLDPQAEWPDRILVTDSQRVKDPIKWKSSSVMTDRWRLCNGKELYDIKQDPGQTTDVSSGQPQVVDRLRQFYEDWWTELEPSFSQATAISLGHPAENPTRLTSHDWITTGSTPWNQSHVRKAINGPKSTGFWNVDVKEEGTYAFHLRRWPKEIDHRIVAALPPGPKSTGEKAFRETPGKAIDARTARVEIAGEVAEAVVPEDAAEVVLKLRLKKGKSELTASFVTQENQVYGAYYVYVERLTD
ncbi:MAG: arylsulfatase [Planctomycetota bacterium]